MSEQVDQKQLRLKRLVIGLGILLVICFCIVVGTMAYRLSQMGADEATVIEEVEPVLSGVSPVVTLVDLDIVIPDGSRIISVDAQGAHYLVLLETKNGQQVQVVNQSDGTLVRTLRFNHPQ